MPRQKKTSTPVKDAASYRHPEADLPARPEIGAQAHFKKVKAPAAYRFDSSLAPELCCTTASSLVLTTFEAGAGGGRRMIGR